MRSTGGDAETGFLSIGSGGNGRSCIITKVYIAGPMAGHPDYPVYFKAAQNQLEAQGLVALNPAVLPMGMEQEDYMNICLSMVRCADVVALLPGWENSPGAKLEAEYGHYIGKKVDVLEQVLRGW